MSPNFKAFLGVLLLAGLLFLPSCSSLEALAVTPEDNAFACLKGSSNAVGGIVGGNVSGITVEVPAGTDTTNWTAQDWKDLSEACD